LQERADGAIGTRDTPKVTDLHAPLGQELLDIPEAEREVKIHPHGTLDDIRWKAIARI
jgi:hypothetical protein